MRGHVVLSLKQLAGNSCKVSENVLCPAVMVSPAVQIECFVKVCVLLKYMSAVLQINVWALIVRTQPGPMSFG